MTVHGEVRVEMEGEDVVFIASALRVKLTRDQARIIGLALTRSAKPLERGITVDRVDNEVVCTASAERVIMLPEHARRLALELLDACMSPAERSLRAVISLLDELRGHHEQR